MSKKTEAESTGGRSTDTQRRATAARKQAEQAEQHIAQAEENRQRERFQTRFDSQLADLKYTSNLLRIQDDALADLCIERVEAETGDKQRQLDLVKNILGELPSESNAKRIFCKIWVKLQRNPDDEYPTAGALFWRDLKRP